MGCFARVSACFIASIMTLDFFKNQKKNRSKLDFAPNMSFSKNHPVKVSATRIYKIILSKLCSCKEDMTYQNGKPPGTNALYKTASLHKESNTGHRGFQCSTRFCIGVSGCYKNSSFYRLDGTEPVRFARLGL